MLNSIFEYIIVHINEHRVLCFFHAFIMSIRHDHYTEHPTYESTQYFVQLNFCCAWSANNSRVECHTSDLRSYKKTRFGNYRT